MKEERKVEKKKKKLYNHHKIGNKTGKCTQHHTSGDNEECKEEKSTIIA